MRLIDELYQDHIETQWDHAHVWTRTSATPDVPTQAFFYPNVFPEACACGALRKFDGTVLPARLS